MNLRDECSRIRVEDLEFSVAILTPKPAFLTWLDGFKAQQGLAAYRIHNPIEDSVWLVPKLHSFTEPGSRDQFIQQMKPRLLLSELYRFGIDEREFGKITAETFDMNFELELRMDAAPISELLEMPAMQ